jgi:hypothetical protein
MCGASYLREGQRPQRLSQVQWWAYRQHSAARRQLEANHLLSERKCERRYFGGIAEAMWALWLW